MCTTGICRQVLINTLNCHLGWHSVNTRLTLNQHLDWHSINSWQGVHRLICIDLHSIAWLQKLVDILTHCWPRCQMGIDQVLMEMSIKCWSSVDWGSIDWRSTADAFSTHDSSPFPFFWGPSWVCVRVWWNTAILQGKYNLPAFMAIFPLEKVSCNLSCKFDTVTRSFTK